MPDDALDDDTARFVRRMERWFDMDAQLADRGLSVPAFARKWGVDPTTALRELKALCKVMGAPLGQLGCVVWEEQDSRDGRRKRYSYMTDRPMLAEALSRRIRAQHPPAAKPTPSEQLPGDTAG